MLFGGIVLPSAPAQRWTRSVHRPPGSWSSGPLGGTRVDDSSIGFNVTDGDWIPVTTCVMATTSRSDIRVRFYPSENAGTIGIDVVRIR